jgi:hypothetical protein
MDQSRSHDPSAAPTRPPVDAEEERQRLRRDAADLGIDPDAAEEAVRRVAHAQPLPDAYRSIDRRLATGYTLVEAEGLVSGAIEDPHALGSTHP